MKHLKSYNEGFLDYFRRDSEDDKLTLDILNNRLGKHKNIIESEEVKDIRKIFDNSSFPNWVSNIKEETKEYYGKIYIVEFDDMDVLITNDSDLQKNICVNKWKMYIGTNSGLCQKINSKESYRKNLFKRVESLYESYFTKSGSSFSPKDIKSFDYKNLTKSELNDLINQALDKKDFERVRFLSKYIKESYIQTISRKKIKI